MEALKPCPFCECLAEIHDQCIITMMRETRRRYYVVCLACQARGGVGCTPEMAVEQWNMRVMERTKL
jgi:Lar family restriction alleviation protein